MADANQNIGVQITIAGVFIEDNGGIRAEINNAIVTAVPAIRNSAKNDTLRSFTGGGAGEKLLKNRRTTAWAQSKLAGQLCYRRSRGATTA